MPPLPETKGAQEALQAMTERGLRVIAVASRPAQGNASEAEEVETGLELLGLVGLEDPPRPHAAESVAACREAGIKVAMITGDHPATAEAIAREIGLAGQDCVLQGHELPEDETMLLGALSIATVW